MNACKNKEKSMVPALASSMFGCKQLLTPGNNDPSRLTI
jgi:hypothetical protein